MEEWKGGGREKEREGLVGNRGVDGDIDCAVDGGERKEGAGKGKGDYFEVGIE